MAAIAVAAGVSRPTVFNTFGSKVELLRVTERTGFDSLPMALTEDNALARGMRNGPGSLVGRNRDSGEIETYAIIGVDYALAPLR